MTEREIFVAALRRPDPPDRQAFLADACGPDAGLRGRLDGLLAEYDRLGSFLERPAAAPAATAAYDPDAGTTAAFEPAADAPPAGNAIGPYKLLEVIGEGGMGTVWMAEQVEPIRRRVAVKLIKPGMDSRAVLLRFEAERQALALMDHPHIARVLDAGSTPDGRPYFVMELVRGVPITTFCDDRHLSVADRLRVFQQVCGAVQHAHQKGVIHRDLKPGNVLVESHDGKPVPKVIDFGLAKAVGAAPLTERSLVTGFGAVLGTPLYMAPEQADLGAVDVDTRADVYALGVLLYELLTGTTPVEKKRLAAAAWDEVRRVIREEEPPAPSARLSLSAGRASVAALRQTDPGRLGRFVRGDLDWVVMKALAKERARRYESAAGFAADIERFLNHEPVAAGPPTAGYRARKFVRRNRGPVAVALLLGLALVLGAAGTTWGMVRATRAVAAEQHAREDAQQERAIALQAAEAERAARQAEADQRAVAQAKQAEAEVEKKRAEAQAAAATAAKEFLQDVLVQGNLGEATRDRAADPNRTLRDALDWASRGIAGRFVDQPVIEADLRETIGLAYRSLGAYPAAESHLRAALDVLEKAHGPDDSNTLGAVYNLASLYWTHGDYAAAEPLYRRALAGAERAFGPDDPNTLAAVSGLAVLYQDRGDYVAAEPLYRRALAGRERALGPDDPHTLAAANNLANLHGITGDYAAAEPLQKRVLAGREKVLGPDHPLTLQSIGNLAALYWQMGRLDRSVPLLEESYRRHRRVLGDGHPDTLGQAANLGVNLKDAGRVAEALPLLERAHAARAAAPVQAGWAWEPLAEAYQTAGRPADAARVVAEALAEGRDRLKPGTPERGDLLVRAGRRLFDLDPAAAESVLRECLGPGEKPNPTAWSTANAKSLLGGLLLRRGEPAEAEPLLVAGYEGLLAARRSIPANGRQNLPTAADRLIDLYVALGKPDEVKRWRAERSQYPFVAPPPRPANRR